MRTYTWLALVPVFAASAAWPCSIALELTDLEPAAAAERMPLNGMFWFNAGPNVFVTRDADLPDCAGEEDCLIPSAAIDSGRQHGVQFVAVEHTPGPGAYELAGRELNFEVIDELDETPPVLQGELAMEVEPFDLPVVGGLVVVDSCGPGQNGRFLTVTAPPATDDFRVAGYVLTFGPEESQLRGQVGAENRDFRFFLPDAEPLADVEVRAFDIAGNLSDPLTTTEPGSCASVGGSSSLLGLGLLALLGLRRRRR